MNSRQSHFIVSSFLLIVILAACAQSPATTPTPPTPPVSAPASGGCANAYFPVSSGNNWSYSSTGSTLGAYTNTWTITDLSDTGFTINDQSSLGTGTTAIIKWECQDGKIAALDAGASSLSLSTSKYKLTSNSITAKGYNIPSTFNTGDTWSETVTINGTVVTSTRSMDSQIVSKVDCSAVGTDSVSVPAGTFNNAAKVTCTNTVAVSVLLKGTPIPAEAPKIVNITDWYAKGVGLVKSVKVNGATGDTETILLTQYKVQ
jgi:hypothetical protein